MNGIAEKPGTSASVVDVRNPRTGRNDCRFEQIGAVELRRLTLDARAAQSAWRGIGVEGRCQALLELADAIAGERDALFQALSADTGRSGVSAMEISAALSAIERWRQLAPALLAPQPRLETSIPFIEVEKQLVPYSLVGVISPWNVPLLLSLIDTIPALLAGSAVIVKPSEITPRFIEPLCAMIARVPALQPVLHFLPGDARLGSRLIGHLDLVCFTGSVATGKKVAAMAAQNFIPCQLELGGKDPAIITANTDLERAAAAICWGGMANAGQSCLSIERVYAERSIHDDFIRAIVAKARSLRLNTGNIDDGEIGPIISAEQRNIIEDHLRDAREKGARVECGGEIVEHGGGLWCQPAILSGVNHDMRIMTEETFAPVLPIMAFDTEEHAIELANDTVYGLSAAVFSDDPEQARRIAGRLEAGAISINDAALTGIMHEGEKQAFKLSGMGGSRMGAASIRRFLRARALMENTRKAWDPWWFHGEDTPPC